MTTETGVRAEVSADRTAVHIQRAAGRPALTHRIGAGQRPSIHPLHDPSGNGILTEDSPGHHPWQHGLYTGFNLVDGLGFWKEQPEDGTFHPTLAVNSEGQRNGGAEQQRARWAAVSMSIAGLPEWCGVAIMDHPDNPAHPVTWRVDNELGLSPSRCIGGSWTIGAGETDRYRYRLHVFRGAIDPMRLEERWQRFAGARGGDIAR